MFDKFFEFYVLITFGALILEFMQQKAESNEDPTQPEVKINFPKVLLWALAWPVRGVQMLYKYGVMAYDVWKNK